MKIKFIFLYYLLIFLVYISCKTNIKEENLDNNSTIDVFLNTEFKNKIFSFVEMIDSLPKSREMQNVIIVDFIEFEKENSFNISSNYYYKTNELEGFIIEKDYLICFYNILDNSVINKLIDTSKLKKNVPIFYKNEFTALKRPYNERVKEYVIDTNNITITPFLE